MNMKVETREKENKNVCVEHYSRWYETDRTDSFIVCRDNSWTTSTAKTFDHYQSFIEKTTRKTV